MKRQLLLIINNRFLWLASNVCGTPALRSKCGRKRLSAGVTANAAMIGKIIIVGIIPRKTSLARFYKRIGVRGPSLV
jgi:hypothetical protein